MIRETNNSKNNINYPKEAVPLGTYVRANRHNKLGIITDGFYDGSDADGQQIIMYRVLLLPNPSSFGPVSNNSERYYLSNEYEYEVTAFLMVGPVDVSKMLINLEGGLY
jgi:hypothetical protein|tara:strand:+ start:110 stop:436 length:327 start_codon:yes stop_codon:yes gene_type:complete